MPLAFLTMAAGAAAAIRLSTDHGTSNQRLQQDSKRPRGSCNSVSRIERLPGTLPILLSQDQIRPKQNEALLHRENIWKARFNFYERYEHEKHWYEDKFKQGVGMSIQEQHQLISDVKELLGSMMTMEQYLENGVLDFFQSLLDDSNIEKSSQVVNKMCDERYRAKQLNSERELANLRAEMHRLKNGHERLRSENELLRAEKNATRAAACKSSSAIAQPEASKARELFEVARANLSTARDRREAVRADNDHLQFSQDRLQEENTGLKFELDRAIEFIEIVRAEKKDLEFANGELQKKLLHAETSRQNMHDKWAGQVEELVKAEQIVQALRTELADQQEKDGLMEASFGALTIQFEHGVDKSVLVTEVRQLKEILRACATTEHNKAAIGRLQEVFMDYDSDGNQISEENDPLDEVASNSSRTSDQTLLERLESPVYYGIKDFPHLVAMRDKTREKIINARINNNDFNN